MVKPLARYWYSRPGLAQAPISGPRAATTTSCGHILLASQGEFPYTLTSKKRILIRDSIYGSSPDFINTVEKYPTLRYLVSVPSDTPCWLTAPITREKKYKYGGQMREKIVPETTQKKPISVESLAKSINTYFWYRRKVSEGTKGPIEYEFTKRRIVLSKNGIPDRTVWLVIRRTIGLDPSYRYYINNAPVSTRLPTFLWLSGIR